MKPLFLLIIFVFPSLIKSSAQNVPNGSFDNWTSFGFYEVPDSWNTTDSVSLTQGSHSATKETVDFHSTPYALKLFPFNSFIGTIPGVASNGKLNTSTLSFTGGSIDTVRHQTLNGWYKYSPVSNDSCSVIVTLFKWDGATKIIIATGVFGISVATSVYTPFTINLAYATTDTPDSMLLSVYSSALGASHIGTVLLVDDFSFTGVVSGLNEPADLVNSVTIFPVPASNKLTVALDLRKNMNTTFEIADATGKKMIIHEMNPLKTEDNINISVLSNGNYVYTVRDEKGNKLASGKLIVNR